MGKKESDTVKDSLQPGGRPSASKVLHYWRQHLTHPRFSTHQDLCMEAALAPLTKWYSLLLGHSLSDVGFVCHAEMQNIQIFKKCGCRTIKPRQICPNLFPIFTYRWLLPPFQHLNYLNYTFWSDVLLSGVKGTRKTQEIFNHMSKVSQCGTQDGYSELT